MNNKELLPSILSVDKSSDTKSSYTINGNIARINTLI